MKRKFSITYSICGTMIIEASNKEEAKRIAENMSKDEILQHVESAIDADGYMVGEVEEEEV